MQNYFFLIGFYISQTLTNTNTCALIRSVYNGDAINLKGPLFGLIQPLKKNEIIPRAHRLSDDLRYFLVFIKAKVVGTSVSIPFHCNISHDVLRLAHVT